MTSDRWRVSLRAAPRVNWREPSLGREAVNKMPRAQLSLLLLPLLHLPPRPASAAECSDSNFDCATCRSLSIPGTLYGKDKCYFCTTTGECSDSDFATCGGGGEWIRHPTACPAAQQACSGEVCDEPRFTDDMTLPAGNGLRAKACCEHGSPPVHHAGEAQATCSYANQNCVLTCGAHMHVSGTGPNATCVCDPDYYDIGHKCVTHCVAADTCNGHGTCNAGGHCDCDPGWYDVPHTIESTKNHKQCTLHCGQHQHKKCTAAGKCHCECDDHYHGSDCMTYCDSSISCSASGDCGDSGICTCDSPDSQGQNHTGARWDQDNQRWINCSEVVGAHGGAAAPPPPPSAGGSADDQKVDFKNGWTALKVLSSVIMIGCFCVGSCMCCSQRRDKRATAAATVGLSQSLIYPPTGGSADGGSAAVTGQPPQQQQPGGAAAAPAAAVDLSSSFMARAQFASYVPEVAMEPAPQYQRCETLDELLETLGLSEYGEALAGLGVQEIEHLSEMSVEDLEVSLLGRDLLTSMSVHTS